MNKLGVTIGVILGVLFVILAVFYWLTPAGSLPSFMPGFIAGSGIIHFKHGLVALILAVLAFVFAWFASGKKAS
jgi:hypothetical protein